MSEPELFPHRPIIRLERHKEHQRYFLKDGTQVSGVSGISKLGDSYEGIIYWAWSLGVKGQDYRKIRDSAADTGQIAHFLVDCYLGNADPDLREFTEEEIALAQPSFDKFMDFWSKEHLAMVAKEEQMVHETLRYGGTLDLRCTDERGDCVLIDWKTSKRLNNSHKWQLGGYELLSNFNHPEQEIARRAVVRIGRDKDDSFHAHWISTTKAIDHMRIFQAQVVLYNAINANKYGARKRGGVPHAS